EPPALRPVPPEACLLQGSGLIIRPGQYQVRLTFAALLRGFASGQRPDFPRRFPKALPQVAEKASGSLPRSNRGGRDQAQTLISNDGRTSHGADALPVLKATVPLAGQPQHQAAVIRDRFQQNTWAEGELAPVWYPHSTCLDMRQSWGEIPGLADHSIVKTTPHGAHMKTHVRLQLVPSSRTQQQALNLFPRPCRFYFGDTGYLWYATRRGQCT